MKKLFKKIIPFRLWNALRNRYYNSKELYSKYILHDYSQAGETVAIRDLLQKRKGEKGFFIEIGANDGVTVSATFGLMMNGWSGLSVEANPSVFERLQKNLKKFPKVKTVCVAVAPEKGTIKLYYGNNDSQGLLSTISTESSVWFEKHRSLDFIDVTAIPLTELLEEQEVPLCPDLLVIDTEGMDYEILLTLNFQKYRPKLIVTEDYQPKNAMKFRMLEQAGYTFTRQVGCNTFWLSTQ